jgi:hypothetical protein
MDHMHEVSVMQMVVETLLASMEKAGASRVTSVQLTLSTSGHFIDRDMPALWRGRIGDLSPGWVFHSYD